MVLHTLCDCVLVRTGESREHERAAVRLAGIYLHIGEFFVFFHQLGHIRKVKTGVHALREHIQRKRDYIHVTRAFAVAEQRAFHPVRTRKQREFRIRHRAAPVVVGMRGHDYVFPVLHILTHILYLLRVYVRHTLFHRDGQIDYDFAVGSRFPYVQHRIAYLQREFRLRTRKTFGRVFESEVALRFLRLFLKQFRARNGNVHYLRFFLAENLLTLCHRRGIIKMYDSPLRSLQRRKRLFYYMFARLRKYLYGDVVGNEITLDKRAAEVVLRLARRGEPYLYFLKSYLTKQGEELQFLL